MSSELLKRRDEAGDRLSGRLQALRHDRGFTIERFAEACSTPTTTAREWLNGRVAPSADGLVAIASGFGVSIDWILFGAPFPMDRTQSRTQKELAEDLARHAIREGLTRAAPFPQPWYRELLTEMLIGVSERSLGERLLSLLLDAVEGEIRANARSLELSAEIGTAIDRIRAAAESGDPMPAGDILELLQRFYRTASPPDGKIIRWESVTISRREGDTDE